MGSQNGKVLTHWLLVRIPVSCEQYWCKYSTLWPEIRIGKGDNEFHCHCFRLRISVFDPDCCQCTAKVRKKLTTNVGKQRISVPDLSCSVPGLLHPVTLLSTVTSYALEELRWAQGNKQQVGELSWFLVPNVDSCSLPYCCMWLEVNY